MKQASSLHHGQQTISVLTVGAIALACVLSSLAPQALACSAMVRVPKPMRISQTQILLPTVADRMDHWSSQYPMTEGDRLRLLLPNGVTVEIQGDKDKPAIERIESGDLRFSEGVFLQLSQPGYAWWHLIAAKPGSSSINIDTGAQKKALKIDVKPAGPLFEYVSVPSTPYTMALDNATREKPFSMGSGKQVEVTLSGELKDGWSANDTGEAGVVLQRVEKLPVSAGSDRVQIKLTFSAPHSSSRREPYHLVIKRGSGLFGGESFHFYLLIHPSPTC